MKVKLTSTYSRPNKDIPWFTYPEDHRIAIQGFISENKVEIDVVLNEPLTYVQTLVFNSQELYNEFINTPAITAGREARDIYCQLNTITYSLEIEELP